MFRHHRIVLLGSALAASLAACYPAAKPASSVSALSYQIQPTGTGGATRRATDPSCAPSADSQLVASPAPAPHPANDPNDPLLRLDMP